MKYRKCKTEKIIEDQDNENSYYCENCGAWYGLLDDSEYWLNEKPESIHTKTT